MLNQVQPFNEHRFDACMNYLTRRYNRFLDQYDIAKLHVLIDFFHILETGKPVIGGALERWPLGPVVKQGYNRARTLGYAYDQQPSRERQALRRGLLQVVAKTKKAYTFTAYGEADDSDFSPAEIAAMESAWQTIAPKSFAEKTRFFHDSGASFIGKVWTAAKKDGTPISWLGLVEAYDQEQSQDHALAKTMLRMWQA
jgi:uncharacterized phage-associated protein